MHFDLAQGSHKAKNKTQLYKSPKSQVTTAMENFTSTQVITSKLAVQLQIQASLPEKRVGPKIKSTDAALHVSTQQGDL